MRRYFYTAENEEHDPAGSYTIRVYHADAGCSELILRISKQAADALLINKIVSKLIAELKVMDRQSQD